MVNVDVHPPLTTVRIVCVAVIVCSHPWVVVILLGVLLVQLRIYV